jgi:dTDP-4-dehydrorhamnose reductase
MKLLITGSSGFLGRRAAAYFIALGHQVLTPSSTELNITDEDTVTQWFEQHHPEAVIHCAAVSDTGLCQKKPEWSHEINVSGSVHLASACNRTGAKFLFCSSDQVYFATPTNIYAKEKLAAEQEGLAVNPDSVFLRLSWMYDPGLTDTKVRSDFFTNLLTKLHTGEEMAFAVHDRRGITDVNEVIRNMEKTFTIPGGIYDFGAPNDKNMYETAVAVFAGLDLDTGRVRENREAFCDSPRNMTMDQEKVNSLGIYFRDTVEALVQNFKKYYN